jgi:hypothetical protein
MLDDLLGQLFGEVVFGRLSVSRRAQLLARLFFGLLGAVLSVIGALHFFSRADLTANHALRASVMGTMLFFGAFWLFNVAFGRSWRWPAIGFIASFVAMFVTRIAFGR